MDAPDSDALQALGRHRRKRVELRLALASCLPGVLGGEQPDD